MSAVEIIERLKTLPATERQKVKAFLAESDGPARNESGVGREISEGQFEKAADEVFTKYQKALRKLAQ